jgi:hypothetical protein
MCMFSGPVGRVSQTRIFARTDGARQFLVYEMRLDAPTEVAMVLPLPLAPGADESAVKFIDLSDYSNFFGDLEKCFPAPQPALRSRGAFAAPARQTLEVVRVGSFEASVVPTLADFDRLDARFRLSDDIWKQLPQYRDFGFAVFKFREGHNHAHPMAFSFTTRHPDQAFFPLVHVHDGAVHRKAEFDHTLFLQNAEMRLDWGRSTVPVTKAMDLTNPLKGDRTHGIVLPTLDVHRLVMAGEYMNKDVVV